MRIRVYAACALMLIVCGCRSFLGLPPQNHQARVTHLTTTQKSYLYKYCWVRKLVTDFFKLPADASAEDIRPRIASYLGLPEDSLWSAFLQTKLGQKIFTEERRAKFAAILGDSHDASWIEMKDMMEDLRSRL